MNGSVNAAEAQSITQRPAFKFKTHDVFAQKLHLRLVMSHVFAFSQ
jgi:hypothetical protein